MNTRGQMRLKMTDTALYHVYVGAVADSLGFHGEKKLPLDEIGWLKALIHNEVF
jgi:hypothetical protein